MKAFYGAEGYGSLAAGGTAVSLHRRQPERLGGGLARDAIATAGATPRTIVFAVGGTTRASDPLPVAAASRT
ncbi:MAG: hypothetical protein IPK07_24175 [Deltaproteobacteria bacterium]|nr:hypothetical protein [Deltaproteobacteria bacterium]